MGWVQARPRAHFYVVLHEGRWKINFEGRHSAPYASQAYAIRAAVDTAHQLGLLGHDAQVLVQGTDGHFRTEWTYGHDPYPPRG